MKPPFVISLTMIAACAGVYATPDSDEPETPREKRTPGISQQDLVALLSKADPFGLPKTDVAPALAPENLNKALASALNIPALREDQITFDSTVRVGTNPVPVDELIKLAAERAKDVYGKSDLVTVGDTEKKYDLIVQIGHYKRTKGRTGGAGKLVTEQQIAALVGHDLLEKLAAVKIDGKELKTILIGADNFKNGPGNLKTRIFIAFHTDAADKHCVVGPSVGYNSSGNAIGMHGIALALACTLGVEPARFMRDNYTKDLRGYYALSKVDADDFKGVLEMSELTCPTQENTLLERVDDLTTNLAVAIQFALRPAM